MNTDVLQILHCYPQVYLACHVDHVRKRSNEHQLSSTDSAILAHLDTREPLGANELARHIGVRPSTLSAALKRLESLCYIERQESPRDRRRKLLLLTRGGQRAMAATSVLDPARVQKLLDKLDPAERKRALDGLALLARAARRATIIDRKRQ
jgi:DNA-binding MarR family transcriptional regulator